MNKLAYYTLVLVIYWVGSWMLAMAFHAELFSPIEFILTWGDIEAKNRLSFMVIHGGALAIIYLYLITTKKIKGE